MYFAAFFSAFILSVILTMIVRRVAWRFKVLDVPGADPRHIHKYPIPLLGGIAVFVSFVVVLCFFAFTGSSILGAHVSMKQIIGVIVGGLVLIIGGALDDKYDLKPQYQFLFSLAAVFVVIASGIGIREITNPFGGVINLATWERVLFWYHGVGYRITLPADALTAMWLLVMIYTTKFLDGLDGLVSGVTAIGALAIAALTMMTRWYQPNVGFMSLIFAGALIGFLVFNWHPAKIFLGNGGSMFAGFMLGILAVISGGKIATALLVMGIPFLDAIWVIVQRIMHHRSPTKGDRSHLHFRLLDLGFSHRQAVLFLYAISLAFGATTIFLQSKEKLIALGVLAVCMVFLVVYVAVRFKPKI